MLHPIGRLSASALLAAALAAGPALAADHIDAPFTTANPNSDINDLYAFTPTPDTVALVMTVVPFSDSATRLNPDYLYQFKLDTDGDAVEDQVIQVIASGTEPDQRYFVNGPVAPNVLGATGNTIRLDNALSARFGQTTTDGSRTAFVGLRDDPFFFDLARFGQIIDDVAGRDGSGPGLEGTPDEGFNDPGTDTLGGANTLAIVVEVPRAALGGGTVGVWATSSIAQ